MRQRATYQEQSKVFLEKAHTELEEGDLHQASEKGWGAAAQILKAVAEERGWEHGSHRLLFDVAGRLASETQSEEFRDGFSAAHLLHINCYEGWLDRTSVEAYLSRVEQFVSDTEAVLNDR